MNYLFNIKINKVQYFKKVFTQILTTLSLTRSQLYLSLENE